MSAKQEAATTAGEAAPGKFAGDPAARPGLVGPSLVESPAAMLVFLIGLALALAVFAFLARLTTPMPPWLFAILPNVVVSGFTVLALFLVLTPPKLTGARVVGVLGALGLAAVTGLALSAQWAGAAIDRPVVGGLLPVGDPQAYYMEALAFGEGAKLSGQAANHPMAPSAFAALLAAFRQNLQVTQFLLAGLALLASGAVGLALARSHGLGAGLLATGLMGAFALSQLVGLLTASLLAFVLGAAAFALLWEASLFRRRLIFLLGLFLLACALLVEGGAFLAPPLLILAGALRFRGSPPQWWGWLALATVSIVLPMFLHGALVASAADPDHLAPVRHYGMTLYGLAVGGGLEQLMMDHGKDFDASMPDAEWARLMGQKGWDAVLAHPVAFARNSAQAIVGYVLLGGPFRFFTATSVADLVVLSGIGLCCATGVLAILRRLARPLCAMTLLAGIGMLLSGPFLLQMEANTEAATLAFGAALAALGFAAIFRLLPGNGDGAVATSSAGGVLFPGILGFGALALIPLGFLADDYQALRGLEARRFLPADVGDMPKCAPGEDWLVLRHSAGSSVYIMTDADPPRPAPSWWPLPAVRLGDVEAVERQPLLRQFVPEAWLANLYENPEPVLVRLAYNVQTRRDRVLLAPLSELPGTTLEPVILCGLNRDFHFEAKAGKPAPRTSGGRLAQ